MSKILFVFRVNEFVLHGISNLLLGEKQVRASAPNFGNYFAKSGETAWAALRAAHSLVRSKPLSSILVRRAGFEPA